MTEQEMKIKLGALIELLAEAAWEGSDIDGGIAQDTLLELDLIEPTEATEEDEDYEVGDTIYRYTEFAKQCVKEMNDAKGTDHE